jgi:electron transport complex protein RnfE
VLGKGTLFSGIDLALGDMAQGWVLHIIPDYKGFLIAILPPGAFIGLGLLIAGRNWLNLRAQQKARSKPARATLASPEAAQG